MYVYDEQSSHQLYSYLLKLTNILIKCNYYRDFFFLRNQYNILKLTPESLD